MSRTLALFALTIFFARVTFAADEPAVDVVVYGGTSGGITAAIQAVKMGKTVVLIEPSQHLGGLTTGGLGATDIGNKAVIGGLSREFYRRIGAYYAQDSAWNQEKQADYQSRRKAPNEMEMWTFEPHVAEKVYHEWLKEHGITTVMGERLNRKTGVVKSDDTIVSITMESGKTYPGKVFIDATYEGDLMAAAGVSYHVGREANSDYAETLNGIQVAHSTKHQFIKDVDPYVTPGDPSSGLLPLISSEPPGKDGEGDHRLQAYNFRMCTTDAAENRRAWPKPEGYDEKAYELLLRNFEAGDHRSPWNPVWMPNRKTDTNNNFAISTDYIGANYDYPEADYARRAEIIEDHKRYQLGLMYTLANNPRVPQAIRDEFQRLGLAKDEFVDNDNWPHQLYVREARRMKSGYVMCQADCQGDRVAVDPVGMGAYNMDSHNCQRYVTAEGVVRNEGDIQVGVSPYPVSYQSIRPRQDECDNLLVPVALSASHIAYGSIRMEPVFMVLGQSAATAAVLAINAKVDIQDIDYAALRKQLLADGQILEYTGPKRNPVRSIDPKSLTGIVVDNTAARTEGAWESSASISGFVGGDYLHDGDASKGSLSIQYTPDLPRPALYEIRVYYTASSNRAAEVPVTVEIAGKKKTVTINQKVTPKVGDYIPIGAHSCPAGKLTSVTISNAGTTGYVVADAVEFVPVTIDVPKARQLNPLDKNPLEPLRK
jgi:hypothetical protein